MLREKVIRAARHSRRVGAVRLEPGFIRLPLKITAGA
jgi:hypothetical protein